MGGVPPLQIVSPVVLISPEVKIGLTVTVGVPETEAAVHPLKSFTDVSVYTVVALGLTDVLLPLVYVFTVPPEYTTV